MLNLLNRHYHHAQINPTHYKDINNTLTVAIAILVTIYFWRANILGIHESSDKALRIMQLTTLMGVIVILWSAATMIWGSHPLHAPPMTPVFTDSGIGGAESSKGWLEGFPRIVGSLGILIAFGHTLLAMSGEESLAQVNREIEAPKLKNLLRAGFVIFLYSMLLTSLVSFLAVLIIPDGMRVATMVVKNGHKPVLAANDYVEVDYLHTGTAPDGIAGLWGYELHRTTDTGTGEITLDQTTQLKHLDPITEHVERSDGGYRDNLINGMVQFLIGKPWMKIILECFVVVVGFLILAGAVNTSIVGSNGVLNRLAEDGVLTPWFQHPHPRFGTTHRLIDLVAILQIIVIVASLGDVNKLGEAYAFGVIWSFVFMTMSMTVLRFKDKNPRQYQVPLNIHIGAGARQIELPVGIFLVFLILASTALINLVTKETATIWGVGFTVTFLVGFIAMERISQRKRGKHDHQYLEQFNERSSEELTIRTLGLVHPWPILVAARGPRSLPVLEKILRETDTDRRDVVVITCKVLPAMTLGVTDVETTIADEDRQLLTGIVSVAERVGKRVHPVVIPTNNPLYTIATAARDLHANEVVLGVSETQYAETQLEQFAMAWGSATAISGRQVDREMTVRIIGPQVELRYDLE
jgi:amino acid transporter